MADFKALTRFEKEYKVVLEKTDFVREGLELAIKGEIVGRKAYLWLAGRASFRDVASFFRFLAGEEELHRRMLEELKASLQEKGGWRGLKAGERKRISERPPGFKKLLGESDELKKNEIQGILRAMGIELEFRDFYAGMAEKVEDADGKKLFSALARFEQKHYDLLSSIYEEVTSTREYTMG